MVTVTLVTCKLLVTLYQNDYSILILKTVSDPWPVRYPAGHLPIQWAARKHYRAALGPSSYKGIRGRQNKIIGKSIYLRPDKMLLSREGKSIYLLNCFRGLYHGKILSAQWRAGQWPPPGLLRCGDMAAAYTVPPPQAIGPPPGRRYMGEGLPVSGPPGRPRANLGQT